MSNRRQFLRLSLASLVSGALGASIVRGQQPERHVVWLPLVQAAPPPPPTPTPSPLPVPSPTPIPPEDSPLLGRASGSAAQAIAWLDSRADISYRGKGVQEIVAAYQGWGETVGMDWFLALAQCCHETGNLTSFWSQRPQRNPAGIGVTGRHRSDWNDNFDQEREVDGLRWSYNYQRNRWEDGLRFATWADHAVPAHLGRLLAYALRDSQANTAQRSLIATALAVRPLPDSLRGVASSIIGLNGKWAVPGTDYGQSILRLRNRMLAL